MGSVRHSNGRSFTKTLALARRFHDCVVPKVGLELAEKWESRAAIIPCFELRDQALASLRLKRFHAEGGSIYAAWSNGLTDNQIALIVAFQTISDYLDNLCDRSNSRSEKDFHQLHLAMLDAVNPAIPLHDYYRFHPDKNDDGYLEALVLECRACLSRLPSYSLVEGSVQEMVGLYRDLQVHKHVEVAKRERQLEGWFAQHRQHYPDLFWWEFGAASGSTLGVFALFLAAEEKDLTNSAVQRLRQVYFPWVCGLHILLDYFIDQAEDQTGGDLNLVSYYRNELEMMERLRWFIREATARVATLPNSSLHYLIVKGLVGLYLADRKISQQSLRGTSVSLLQEGGVLSILLFAILRTRNALLRRR